MPIGTEEYTGIGGMTGITEPAGQRDRTFYWPDNIIFSVEDVLFRVPRYPFTLGSEHFVEKYGLGTDQRDDAVHSVVQLEGVTADQFRVFLRFLFPVHLKSTTTTFSKDEWLTILTLATLWHFHEARKLAIQHLHGQLDDLELILVGRAAYVPKWVLAGYRALVERPRSATITEEEGDAIGYREVCRLWAIRYRQVVSNDASGDVFVARRLHSKFSNELAELAAHESEHRTKSDIEREEEEAEGRRKCEEEEREADAERRRLEEARLEELGRFAAEAKAEAQQKRLDAEAKAERDWLDAVEKSKAQAEQRRLEDAKAKAERQRLKEAERTKQQTHEEQAQPNVEQEGLEAEAKARANAEQEAQESIDEVFKTPIPSRSASFNAWEAEAEVWVDVCDGSTMAKPQTAEALHEKPEVEPEVESIEALKTPISQKADLRPPAGEDMAVPPKVNTFEPEVKPDDAEGADKQSAADDASKAGAICQAYPDSDDREVERRMARKLRKGAKKKAKKAAVAFATTEADDEAAALKPMAGADVWAEVKQTKEKNIEEEVKEAEEEKRAEKADDDQPLIDLSALSSW